MTKTFKKIAASVMAATTLAVGAASMTASAYTDNDNYSSFSWDRNGSRVSVSLTNTSGASRYAQVSAYGYNAAGYYVDHISNSGIISDGQTKSASGSIAATSYKFYGNLYSSTVPKGTPLSPWVKTIG